jgi:hypothetical protein
LDNAKKLREDLIRLRTSLSSTSLSKMDFVSSLKKNKSTVHLAPQKINACQKSAKSNIKAKFEQIERKLKDAKKSI